MSFTNYNTTILTLVKIQILHFFYLYPIRHLAYLPMRRTYHRKVMTQHIYLFVKKLLWCFQASHFCLFPLLYHITQQPQMLHLHPDYIHPFICLIWSTYGPSTNFFWPSFFSNWFSLFFLVIFIVLNFQELIFFKTWHVATHKKVDALETNNSIISAASRTKTDALTKRTKSIFI